MNGRMDGCTLMFVHTECTCVLFMATKADGQTDRHSEKQGERQRDRQKDRQIDLVDGYADLCKPVFCPHIICLLHIQIYTYVYTHT